MYFLFPRNNIFSFFATIYLRLIYLESEKLLHRIRKNMQSTVTEQFLIHSSSHCDCLHKNREKKSWNSSFKEREIRNTVASPKISWVVIPSCFDKLMIQDVKLKLIPSSFLCLVHYFWSVGTEEQFLAYFAAAFQCPNAWISAQTQVGHSDGEQGCLLWEQIFYGDSCLAGSVVPCGLLGFSKRLTKTPNNLLNF